ncbi:aminoglycoside phosphotransferase family protein [Paenibacillus qinlingensis]|uniref:aminoglycoside phosphotransferase family protein n=1 Tax=Paenibacillus qinlingensis TaxID=1837343 RepID=UPI001566102A|nr:aminoglycoside phosphotransferase family protein [Paenibacillus qinlingensis]NQX58268.1 aminoglycoside phosphotransferase family protein [Paenibacillus qinlingensis]
MSHSKEIDMDLKLVQQLISSQFPKWAELPLRPVDSVGTDNVIFRLGEDMAVRLPHVDWAIGQVDKEQRWLPKLAPLIPIAIPVPLAKGIPTEDYPWFWSVYRWLEGENATVGHLNSYNQAATALAQFIHAMQTIDPAGGPVPGSHNSGRGEPLAKRDVEVRHAIASLNTLINTDVAEAVWDLALQARVWQSEGVWVHGDLHPGNLLIEQGELSAVIDFGTLGVGDPACDLMVAWTFLTPESRKHFRALLTVDEATWSRGRGWALSFGLIAYTYYIDKNPGLAAISLRTIDEVLSEHVKRCESN